jgi:polyhydroxyalkanoate synthase subunit PhaC
MSSSSAMDLTSIQDRIQSEMQRAIMRSIKGVEYFSTTGPTPKDVPHGRGTMNLYHYRALADEVYRVPVLIVMATTNRGYILDMVPG